MTCAVSVRILFSVGKAVVVGILFARVGFVEFQRAVAVRIFLIIADLGD